MICIDSILDDEIVSGFGEIWINGDEDVFGGAICITC